MLRTLPDRSPTQVYRAADSHRFRHSGLENFLYGFKPGRHGPGRAAACSGYALAPAPLRERAGRLARDTVGPAVDVQCLRPGEGGAHCAEPPPQRQARCASRSTRRR